MQNDFSKFSDEELVEAKNAKKPSPIIDAFFIGFLIGVIIFGVAASAWGFLILLPLFLIYLFLKKPARYEALNAEAERRGL